MTPLILVVDDEASYRDALTSGLRAEGFEVVLAGDAAEAMEAFATSSPDLVLLDVMLPDRPGTDVCREMRLSSEVPIIMVSARSTEVDVVLGLELGASDYVAKPFRLRELTARIRAVLRRSEVALVPDDVVEVGGLRLDSSRREVTDQGQVIDVSRKEFDLLWLLMAHAGVVVTREQCIDVPPAVPLPLRLGLALGTGEVLGHDEHGFVVLGEPPWTARSSKQHGVELGHASPLNDAGT